MTFFDNLLKAIADAAQKNIGILVITGQNPVPGEAHLHVRVKPVAACHGKNSGDEIAFVLTMEQTHFTVQGYIDAETGPKAQAVVVEWPDGPQLCDRAVAAKQVRVVLVKPGCGPVHVAMETPSVFNAAG